MIIVESSATNREHPLQRQIEMTRMEVFLDFDPVFPGWPPTSRTSSPQQQQKGVAQKWTRSFSAEAASGGCGR
jgi:hypothetical protein